MSIETELMTADQLADALDDKLDSVRDMGKFLLSIMSRRHLDNPVMMGIRMGLRDLIDAERNLSIVAQALQGYCCDEHKEAHDQDE